MTHHGDVLLLEQPELLFVGGWTSSSPPGHGWGPVSADERAEVQPGADYQPERPAVHFGLVVEPIFDWVTFDQQEITRGILSGTGKVQGEPIANFLGHGTSIGTGVVTGEVVITDPIFDDPPALTSPEFTDPFSSRSLYDRDRDEDGNVIREYDDWPAYTYMVGMGSDKFVLMRIESTGFMVFELYYLSPGGPLFRSGFQVSIATSQWNLFGERNRWLQTEWTKHNYSDRSEHPDHQLFNISDDRAIYVFNDDEGNIRLLDFIDDEGQLRVENKILMSNLYMGIADEEWGWISEGYYSVTGTPSFASTLAWRGEGSQLFVLVNMLYITWPVPDDIERILELYLMEFDIDSPTGTPVESRWIDVPRSYYWNGNYRSGWMARFFFQMLDVKSGHVDLGGLDDYSGTIGTGDSIVATRLNLTTLEFADIGMLIDFDQEPINYWSYLTHNIAVNDHGYVYAHSDIINWQRGDIIYYYTLSKSGQRTQGIYTFDHIDPTQNNGWVGFLNTKIAWNAPPYLKDRMMMSVWNNAPVETEQWGTYYDWVWTIYTFTFDGVNLVLEEINAPTLKESPILVYEDIGPILYPINESFIGSSGWGYTIDAETGNYVTDWPLVLFQTNTHTFVPIGIGTAFIDELRLNQRDD